MFHGSQNETQGSIVPAREMVIPEILKQIKITDLQLDPFGYCNAKCWFCPVGYDGNPVRAAKHMPIDLLDKIFSDINKEKHAADGVVDKNFNHFYTAHYNEVLLYKYLEEMLFLSDYYGFKTMILSNGLNLTEENVETLKKYKHVLSGINLNIPAFEDELWAERVNVKHKSFEFVRRNVERTMLAFPEFVENGAMSIGVNIPTDRVLSRNGGIVELLENAPNIEFGENGESAKQVALARQLFNGLNVYPVEDLVDRASLLKTHGILDNGKAIDAVSDGKKKTVVGCNNGNNGRLYGWLHVNSLGETFICCQDFKFDYVFGNLKNSSLRDVWLSNEHAKTIEHSLKNICKTCVYAIWQ